MRYLIRDDEKQYQTVYNLFQSAIEGKIKLFTSIIVFFEIYWLLSSFYKKSKKELTDILVNLMEMTFVELTERDLLQEALEVYQKTSLDLEDSYNLIYARQYFAKEFVTFDKRLAKEFIKEQSVN